MGTFYRSPVNLVEQTVRKFVEKSVTRSIKNAVRKTIESLVLLGGLVGCLVLLAGCPDSGGGKEKPTSTTPTPGGGGNTGAPSEPKIIVGDPPFSVTLNENGPETLVDLPYKGQGGAVPTSCTVDSLSMVTVTTPCACSEGVCRVGVQPTPKIFGDGSFEFRLSDQSGQKEISSNAGKASVKVLKVTLSISSGDKQEGTVGKNLGEPIVVLVQNSDKVPVSGAKVFWNVERQNKDWKEDAAGKISSCTGMTDEHGFARCTWTLGTSVFAASKVNAFAFYDTEEEEFHKETLSVSFSATAKPDVAAQLSFWSFYWALPSGPTDRNLYRGSPLFGKDEKACEPLGKESDGGGLWVFSQDIHGNPTTVKDSGVDVTMSLGKVAPVGAVLSGTLTNKMVNINLDDVDKKYAGRMQGVAKFRDLTVNKVGKYELDASDPAERGFGSFTYDDPFSVFPGAAAKLGFTTQPGGGPTGAPWGSQPVVAIQDDCGNTVTSDVDPFSTANIRLVIDINPSANSLGVLSGGVTSLGAARGVAAFSGLKIDRAGNGYTLKASSSGITSKLGPATSSPFNIQ